VNIVGKIQSQRFLYDVIESMGKKIGIGITRYETLEKLRSSARISNDIEFLRAIHKPEMMLRALEYLPKSTSQLRQDLFVLSQLEFKTKGFFVEFGATDGIYMSNTYLLETEFGWTGILAEPASCWFGALQMNRSASIETRCVWKDSCSSLVFSEVDSAELSTISAYGDSDKHKYTRKRNRKYDVSTISLLDLLEKHGAPTLIDYLSIDTEGSEFEILDAFDFSRYRFRVISCEHNYTSVRERIFELLTRNGYSRVLQDVSDFDDWYILDELNPRTA
jgi:FkbM family methyltransferase